MLYRPVGTNVTGLYLFAAISAEHALNQFRNGLKEPLKFADVRMIEVTAADIEADLRAKHTEFWRQVDAGEIGISGGRPPLRNEISGSVSYGADF